MSRIEFKGTIYDSDNMPVKNHIPIGPNRKGGVYHYDDPDRPASEGYPAHVFRISYGEDCKDLITKDLWNTLRKLKKKGKNYTLVAVEEINVWDDVSRVQKITILIMKPRRVGYVHVVPIGVPDVEFDYSNCAEIGIVGGGYTNRSFDTRSEYMRREHPSSYIIHCFGRNYEGIFSDDITEDESNPLCKRSVSYYTNTGIELIHYWLLKKHFS